MSDLAHSRLSSEPRPQGSSPWAAQKKTARFLPYQSRIGSSPIRPDSRSRRSGKSATRSSDECAACSPANRRSGFFDDDGLQDFRGRFTFIHGGLEQSVSVLPLDQVGVGPM